MTKRSDRAREQKELIQRISNSLPEGVTISAIGNFGEEILIHFDSNLELLTIEQRTRINSELQESGHSSSWIERAGTIYLRIKTPQIERIPWVNIALFCATCLSVFFVPQYWEYSTQALLSGVEYLGPLEWISTPGAWLINWGVSFTFWILFILLAHEFGHYFAGKRRNLRLTYPYFIPFPTFIGTMGAFIRFKSPIENRRDLIEIGAAGPIAGFVIAVIAIIYGLTLTDPFKPGIFTFEGESLLMKFLAQVIMGESAFGRPLSIHPATYAGWVGLLITALNLLPLSQLDGGHITYGLFGKQQKYVALASLAGLVIAGSYWPVWWFYGGLAMFYGPFHAPTLNDAEPLTKSSRMMGYLALLIFVVSFSLMPFGR